MELITYYIFIPISLFYFIAMFVLYGERGLSSARE